VKAMLSVRSKSPKNLNSMRYLVNSSVVIIRKSLYVRLRYNIRLVRVL
jgi:hypothetical protein